MDFLLEPPFLRTSGASHADLNSSKNIYIFKILKFLCLNGYPLIPAPDKDRLPSPPPRSWALEPATPIPPLTFRPHLLQTPFAPRTPRPSGAAPAPPHLNHSPLAAFETIPPRVHTTHPAWCTLGHPRCPLPEPPFGFRDPSLYRFTAASPQTPDTPESQLCMMRVLPPQCKCAPGPLCWGAPPSTRQVGIPHLTHNSSFGTSQALIQKLPPPKSLGRKF